MKEMSINKYTILDNFSVDVYGDVTTSYETLNIIKFRKVYGNFYMIHNKYNKEDELIHHPNSPEYVSGSVSMGGYSNMWKDYNKIRKAHKRSSVINNILKKSNV